VASTSSSPRRSRSKGSRTNAKVRRRSSLGRAVEASDVALGVGVAAASPAVRVTRRFVKDAGSTSVGIGEAIYANLPEATRASIEEQVTSLARTGRQARIEAIEVVVGGVVSEVMSSETVRSAMTSAIEGAMEEVVAAAMPSVVERLRDEIGLLKLDEMVRTSVERVLPQVLEQDLTAALVAAAGLPARTARGIVKLPSAVVRSRVLEREDLDPE
jgi:hypothetical protein